MTNRQRADRLLVSLGLFESRARAQAAIAAGLVSADDRPVRKPSDEIPVSAAIRARPAHPFASRGGVKLTAALDRFGLDPAGLACLDVGASTGGFTDALLKRGARHVTAVDVGTGQLHASLSGRPDVTSLERTDIRTLDVSRLPERPALIVIDVSFISLRQVLPPTLALASPDAALVALVKPQFEAGRALVKKGVVRNPEVHRSVCDGIAAFIAGLGWTVGGIIPSPIDGGDGNREFLLMARR